MAQVRNSHLATGMSLSFALCFEGRFANELRAERAPVNVLGAVRMRNAVSVIRVRRRLEWLLRQQRFDVAITHSRWSQIIFGPVLKQARVPLVSWLHGVVERNHWQERWASRRQPFMAISNSRFTAASLRSSYPTLHVEVLYNPLVAAKASPSFSDRLAVRERLGIPADSVVIIQVSRMEPWKGHALHLEALAQIKDLPNWICLQVGGAQRPEETSYVDSLHQQAVRLGIGDRVKFLGSRSDVPDLLNASDIHCQPNTAPEPFGNTFIEALSAGLPVLTVGFGGALEIIDESCGILVPPNNPEDLAIKLRLLIADPLYRARLGAAGRKRALELCGVETQIPTLERILSSVVEAGRPLSREATLT